MPHTKSATPHTPPAISFDHVSFSYAPNSSVSTSASITSGQNIALDDVHFSIRKGEYLAILGPNGGGKTTLLKLMLGLLHPTQGHILLAGQAPQRTIPRIGYVPQYTQARPDFPISVMDAVLMGMIGTQKSLFTSHWRKDSATTDRVSVILEQVGLKGFEKSPFAKLSGGQRQRVIVARALISEPEILLLDEPTASIDPHGAFCFYEFLSSLQGSRTIVVVSHDLSITSTNCSAIAFVNRQVVVHRGSKLSPDMLHMLYGQHTACCPVESFINTISSSLPLHTGGYGQPPLAQSV